MKLHAVVFIDKNKTKILIIIINLVFFILLLIATGMYSDHKYSRVDDRPEPGPITINRILKDYHGNCDIFEARELSIGRDVYIIVIPKNSRRNAFIVQRGGTAVY